MANIEYESVSAIERAVVRCKRCTRLRRHCRDVAKRRKREFSDWKYWGKPVPGFGDHNARLLIVGLAPAAHGANRTGRMFTGDSSGDWLYEALHRFGFANQPQSVDPDDGLELSDCYITASARCAPPANKPTASEMDNCQSYLEAELQLIRPAVVLVLGRIAHERWLKASGWWYEMRPRERPEFGHAAVHSVPEGPTLVCSYHPSRQNTNTGRLTRSMWYEVFSRCRELLG